MFWRRSMLLGRTKAWYQISYLAILHYIIAAACSCRIDLMNLLSPLQVFYLEACESGSIFEGLLPNGINVYATTASNADESSWGTYCPGEYPSPPLEYDTCLGDLYSVAWMEDRYFISVISMSFLPLWYDTILSLSYQFSLMWNQFWLHPHHLVLSDSVRMRFFWNDFLISMTLLGYLLC